MTNYTFVNYKNIKSLIPKEVWLTAEHLSETEPLFMTEHLVDNDGKLYRSKLQRGPRNMLLSGSALPADTHSPA